MKKFLKTYWPLLVILFSSLFFRIYKGIEWFAYTHDNDLTGWFIKDVLVNKHLRLVGQITSTEGILIGPLTYYFQLPFYLINNMDPIGGLWAATFIGVASTFSFWFVFTKVFGKKEGYVAALVHSFSYYLIFNDREATPTMPVILWSVWFLYAVHLLSKGNKWGIILSGVLIGLIWHLNLALVLSLPVLALAIFLSKKKLSKDGILKGVFFLILLSIPLIFFEVRHNFPQVNALIAALTTSQKDIISGWDKFLRVILLLSKNAKSFLFGPRLNISYSVAFALSILTIIALFIKKKLSKKMFAILIAWGTAFILFFSLYSKILSEYYLNGILIVWIVILVLGIVAIINSKLRVVGYLTLALYLALNTIAFFNFQGSRNGYLQRKELVKEIDEDRALRSYPCIAISYIVDPGYSFGYRYFFFLRSMHVNRPDSGAPVYTIVFPLKDIFPTHKNFGALGIIYPDYSRYTKEGVERSCSGENSNLAEPMPGFTQ